MNRAAEKIKKKVEESILYRRDGNKLRRNCDIKVRLQLKNSTQEQVFFIGGAKCNGCDTGQRSRVQFP